MSTHHAAHIVRPSYGIVPLADGLKWRGGGNMLFEEKLDGEWEVSSFKFQADEVTLAGERMRDGRFFAFDALFCAARDLRPLPLRDRRDWLKFILRELETSNLKLETPAFGTGGEFLEAVLARGGEGVVAKDLDAPFGVNWFKCKREETHDLIVVEKHASGKSSVRVAWKEQFQVSSFKFQEAGWLKVSARQFELIKLGDVVEIVAYGLHPGGKLREARFKRVRQDK